MPMSSFVRSSFFIGVCLAAGAIPVSIARAEDEAGQRGGRQFDVPDGTPAELLAFIKKQQGFEPSGTSRKERAEQMQKASEAIVAAAERIAKAQTDEATAATALKAEVEALTLLKRLGDEDAAKKLDRLTAKLQKDSRPTIAAMLKLRTLAKKLENLDEEDSKSVESFISEAKQLVGDAPPEPQMAPLAQAAAVLLFRSGRQDEALKTAREFARKFSASDTPEVAMASVDLAGVVVHILEMQGREKQAAEYYRDLAERLAAHNNPSLKEAAAELERSARQFDLVGQPMPVSGKLLGGGRFDISKYQGKVVLVDFWATWCGPCLAEMPNVKEVYKKYHDRGFEVVGVSLDDDVDALAKFVEEERIEWPILWGSGDDASASGQSLADKYFVSAIPKAILVNRQGRIVSLSARGEKLGKLVEGLIEGASPKKSKNGS